MTYYILLPNDTEKDTKYSTNILGEESFGVFYAEQGMNALNSIVKNTPELMPSIKILNENKKHFTLTEFFDIISKLKIRKY